MKKASALITDFLGHLETEKNRSEATLRNYGLYLKRFCRWAGNPFPSAINAQLIQKYRAWLRQCQNPKNGSTFSAKTRNYHLIALRGFLTFLNRRNIASMPPKKIILEQQRSQTPDALSQEDADRVLAAVARSGAPILIRLRDQAILETLLATGLRVSEFSRLTKKHASLAGNAHALTENAKKAIKQYLARRTDSEPALFISHDRARTSPSRKGRATRALSPRSIQRIVETYAAAAGIDKKITPHTIRKFLASSA